GDVGRDLAVARDRELEPRLARLGSLLRRPHDEYPRLGQHTADLEPLVDSRDAEGGRARLERGAPDVDGAVPVAVRLDDRPELRAVERVEEAPDVVANRAEVDRDLAPVHSAASLVGSWFAE